MKNRLIILIVGELQRLHKYGFTSVSFLVTVIWGVVLYFLETDMTTAILPFILMLDATMMAVMYVGAVMYFEKNESTISTMLVTPVKNSELILSKTIAYTIHNLLSAILLVIVFVWIKDIEIHYLMLFSAIIITTLFHTIAGIVLSYFQKDFTTMLLQIMILSFILFIPSALYMFGVLENEIWEYIMLINPVQAAQEIIGAGFVRVPAYEYDFSFWFSLFYLLGGAPLLFLFVALPRFQAYAIKQSGV
jgi:fluoroquinolone transport system permease protein